MEIIIGMAIALSALWFVAYLASHHFAMQDHRESVQRKAALKYLHKDDARGAGDGPQG